MPCPGFVRLGFNPLDRLGVPLREQPGAFPRVTLARDTWIGERAINMAYVCRHSVIAANSVVTIPIPKCAIALASPARVVRFRTQDESANASVHSPLAPNLL
jgi:hypothetical protein